VPGATRRKLTTRAHRRLRLSVSRAPQREAAFRSGELGELAVGEMLNKRAATGPVIALHDRRVPGRQGNIDHIAVAPSGVYVIDAKHYSGKVWANDRGFRGVRLMVKGRDRSELLEGLGQQVAVVREALASAGHGDVLVQGVLCRRLGRQLKVDGPLAAAGIEAIRDALAAALPPKIVTASGP
jgi:hypothetical protein